LYKGENAALVAELERGLNATMCKKALNPSFRRPFFILKFVYFLSNFYLLSYSSVKCDFLQFYKEFLVFSQKSQYKDSFHHEVFWNIHKNREISKINPRPSLPPSVHLSE
jgi:hypothetical protein